MIGETMGSYRRVRRLSTAAALAAVSLLAVAASAASAPELVEDINPGAAPSFPDAMVDFGGTLVFVADDGTHGEERGEATAPRPERG
jgi:hypothetical protein